MTWGAVGAGAASAGVSLLGGSLLGGGSKAAERAAKDAAARSQIAQDQARRDAKQQLDPYTDLGRNSANKLAQLLGVADPEGYAKRPELQDFVDQVRNEHFSKYGTDYNRNSEMAGESIKAKQRYDAALKSWESGLADYKAKNPGSAGDGGLLKAFSNEDFVKDPGYEFRMAEGEKGLQRQLSKMGSFNSGAALKAIDRYNQDYASNEFTNAFNRDAANKARTFSFLSGASGQGLQAAGTGANINTNAANVNSQIQQNLGNNLSNMYQVKADNQSNLLQSALANGLYAYARNAPITGSLDGSSWFSGASSSGNPLNWWEMT
jgi:hypothetical protein